MENHHFEWVNQLFQWPFSIAILTLPEGKTWGNTTEIHPDLCRFHYDLG